MSSLRSTLRDDDEYDYEGPLDQTMMTWTRHQNYYPPPHTHTPHTGTAMAQLERILITWTQVQTKENRITNEESVTLITATTTTKFPRVRF